MSLHIKCMKSSRIDLLDIAASLINILQIKVQKICFNEKDIENVSEIKQEFKEVIKKEQNFKLEFIILIGNKQGFIQIYDNYDSRIFGDIEADIFEGEFIVLLKEKKFKEKLDNFCKLNISKLNRVIIDHEEEAMRDMRQTFD